MAARAEAEREEQQPTRTTSTRTSSTPAPARDNETSEVSLTAFRMQFPGLVSMGGGAGGG